MVFAGTGEDPIVLHHIIDSSFIFDAEDTRTPLRLHLILIFPFAIFSVNVFITEDIRSTGESKQITPSLANRPSSSVNKSSPNFFAHSFSCHLTLPQIWRFPIGILDHLDYRKSGYRHLKHE
ncbi:hypothetical protein L2E82_49716 [Cichorium intybus]|uniref:Uncharacterized protein n=1 Tax=Cichorium intybus TaxID=13427 RepID=A0ACB8Z0P9_CICIN|nr:hypothetical protein L2E82_49716 [Cichorium intybus]